MRVSLGFHDPRLIIEHIFEDLFSACFFSFL